MKYAIDLRRVEERTVQVFADTPHEAVKLAKQGNPGFAPEAATEVLEGDAEGNCLMVASTCEACGVAIFENEPCAAGDDADLCAKCMEPA